MKLWLYGWFPKYVLNFIKTSLFEGQFSITVQFPKGTSIHSLSVTLDNKIIGGPGRTVKPVCNDHLSYRIYYL